MNNKSFDNYSFCKRLTPCALALLFLIGLLIAPLRATAANLMIYDDALASGWDDWSWSTTASANTNRKKIGTASLAVKYNSGWAGLSYHAGIAIKGADYSAIRFWVYGSTGSGLLRLYTESDSGNQSTAFDFTPTPNVWTEINIPLSSLGNPATIARVSIMDFTGNTQPAYYIDALRLIGKTVPLAMTVDPAANRKPISPTIYGMNYHGEGEVGFMQELKMPVRRWGGNNTSRYNWKIDATNTGMDWYFENVRMSDALNPPNDSAVNRMLDENAVIGSDTLLTVPMLGFVAKDANKTSCAFSIAKYGAQQGNDWQWQPDCGNGVKPDGSFVTGNSPKETSIAVTSSFTKDWIVYLTQFYGKAGQGGVRFYNLDNEIDIWYSTHRDVFPVALKYNQLRDRTYQYAAAIKSVDPAAQVLGPVLTNWSFYWNSPYDIQRQDYATPDDRNAHGGTPLVAWYLQQMKAYEKTNGKRILNYLDLHYYPECSYIGNPNCNLNTVGPGDAAMQALRLRSTRSLWDPNYVDESWIGKEDKTDGGIVKLIPRMKDWVTKNYPGTRLAISEYMWGAMGHINGALAEADVLGIFGREGLDLATLWGAPSSQQPGAFAFRMYRNYNGKGGQFGSTSLLASSSDQGKIAIYAAEESTGGALTLMIINKTSAALSVPVTLKNFAPTGLIQTWRYSAADLTHIVHPADRNFSGSKFTSSFPANSITLFRLPGHRN